MVERLLGHISTRVIAISPRQAKDLLGLGITTPDKLVEVPLGLELDEFPNAPVGELRAELGIGAAPPLVGIVARLVPIKGVDVFVQAARLIALRRPETHFVIVGDGELRDVIELQVRHGGLEPQTHFLGFRADLAGVYADLDVVVQTSHNEGTPVSIIEALAAARAVVATNVGGVADVLADGECGVLVADGDALAIASAVVELLGDPARRVELGERGQRRVLETYGADALLRRIEALYQSLVPRSEQQGSTR
jgi:glycosyltransferase involved in cell wall biosynthesis